MKKDCDGKSIILGTNRTPKKLLLFPSIFTLVVAIACTFEVGILERTQTPGEDSKAAESASSEAPDSDTTQQSPSANGIDCPESQLRGLVFGYWNQKDQSLWRVGTCNEYIQLANQAHVQISPDGKKILYTQDNDLWIADLLDGNQKNLTNTPNRNEVNPRWWPGNQGLIIFGSWGIADDLGPTSGYLSLISANGGDYRILANEPSNSAAAPQPNGSIIAYDLGDSAWLYHLDLDESELFEVSQFGLIILKGNRITSPSWSPDGKKLTWWVSGVFSPPLDGSTALAVYDLEDRNVILTHPYTPIGTGGGLQAPVWSPNGEWMAVPTISEAHKTDLWVISTDGNEEHHLGFASNPVWHPDGSTLVFKALSDNSVRQIKVGEWGQQSVDLPPSGLPLGWLGVNPEVYDGRQPTSMAVIPSFGPQIHFSANADPANSQLVFPYGTPEIFAIWPYQNMQEGSTIRREWYQDSDIWIVREEPWNYAKYGANGVITDISVYDYDQGLEPGRYQLRLYIDGQEQQLGIGEAFSSAFFEVSRPLDIHPHISLDFSQAAIVEPPGTLIIQDLFTLEERTILTMDEISSLAWFPNDLFILFSVRDRSDKAALAEPLGYVDDLWVVNLETGDAYPFQDQSGQVTGMGLHHPYVSPDGVYVAVVEGTGWSDACHVASKLFVKEIGFSGDHLHETFSYYQHGFTIAASPKNGEMYVKRIIGWDSPTRLKVEFGWTCTSENVDGIYLLDMSRMTAEKIGGSD